MIRWSRLSRVAAAIGSRVIEWGCLTPPPPASGGWRNTPAAARLNSALRCLFSVDLLTLAGTDHFASFDGTRGGGVRRPRVWSLIELEPRGKSHRVGRHGTKRAVPSFKVIGQMVIAEVRTMTHKPGNRELIERRKCGCYAVLGC